MKSFLLALIISLITTAATAEEVDFIAKAQNYLNQLKTYEADFRQVTIGDLNVPRGKFYFQAGGKFLWDYQKPTAYKLVSNGSLMFFHDEETLQTTQLPTGAGLSGFLQQNPIKLADGEFKITGINDNGDNFDIALEPREKNADDLAQMQYVVLSFSAAPVQLIRIVLGESAGREIFVDFSGIKENHSLANDLFEFDIENRWNSDS